MLGVYNGAGSGITKFLLHMEGNANDSSGNSNNGTSVNVTYSLANGKLGQGAGLDGNSSYIYTTNPLTATEIGSAWTVSFYINFTALPTSGNIADIVIISAKVGTNQKRAFVIRYKNTAGNYFGVTNIGATLVDYYSNVNIDTSVWDNYVVTFNGTTLNIYKNSKNILSTAASFTVRGDEAFTNKINVGGEFISSLLDPTNAKIDELIVENVAWSAEKVKKHYTMTKGRFGIL